MILFFGFLFPSIWGVRSNDFIMPMLNSFRFRLSPTCYYRKVGNCFLLVGRNHHQTPFLEHVQQALYLHFLAKMDSYSQENQLHQSSNPCLHFDLSSKLICKMGRGIVLKHNLKKTNVSMPLTQTSCFCSLFFFILLLHSIWSPKANRERNPKFLLVMPSMPFPAARFLGFATGILNTVKMLPTLYDF